MILFALLLAVLALVGWAGWLEESRRRAEVERKLARALEAAGDMKRAVTGLCSGGESAGGEAL